MSKLYSFIFPAVTLAQSYGNENYRGSMMGNGWGMMGYGVGGQYGLGLFGLILWLVLLAIIITAVIYLTRYLAGGSHLYHHKDDATEILKSRFARGEITKEDYERMKKDLEKM